MGKLWQFSNTSFAGNLFQFLFFFFLQFYTRKSRRRFGKSLTHSTKYSTPSFCIGISTQYYFLLLHFGSPINYLLSNSVLRVRVYRQNINHINIKCILLKMIHNLNFQAFMIMHEQCEYVCNLIEENKYYVYFECSSGSNCCYSMVQGSNLKKNIKIFEYHKVKRHFRAHPTKYVGSPFLHKQQGYLNQLDD